MKFRLVENLNEELINETLYKKLKQALNFKNAQRGETSLRYFICKTLGLNYNDYILHHKNGNHRTEDNYLSNLILINSNSDHVHFHKYVSDCVEEDEILKNLYLKYIEDGSNEQDVLEAFESHFIICMENLKNFIDVEDAFKKKGFKL